jgi:hypothetical protein
MYLYTNVLRWFMRIKIVVIDNKFRWHFFSGNRYFNDISWAQAYTNNTLLLAAIKYLKDALER